MVIDVVGEILNVEPFDPFVSREIVVRLRVIAIRGQGREDEPIEGEIVRPNFPGEMEFGREINHSLGFPDGIQPPRFMMSHPHLKVGKSLSTLREVTM